MHDIYSFLRKKVDINNDSKPDAIGIVVIKYNNSINNYPAASALRNHDATA